MEKTEDLQKLCTTLYITYALSAFLQFFEQTLLAGLFALVIAYILMVQKRAAAKDTPYESHLRWMTRTVWIGTGVIVPIAIIIATVLILTLTDIASVITAFNNNDPGALMHNIETYMATNMTKVSLITLSTTIPASIWWLRRCWVGYTLAKEGKPVEKVNSWL